MKDFSLGSLAQLGFAHLLSVSELHPSVRKRSQLHSVPRPGRRLCIIEPNPSTHLRMWMLCVCLLSNRDLFFSPLSLPDRVLLCSPGWTRLASIHLPPPPKVLGLKLSFWVFFELDFIQYNKQWALPGRSFVSTSYKML